jgi:hypothetical protein
MIKNVLIIAILFGVIGCGNSKNTDTGNETVGTDTTTVNENPNIINTETDFVDGIVSTGTNDAGCEYIIKVNINGKEVNLEPGALADEFKVDGKQVQLKYSPSKRQSICGDSMPIMIIEIK